MLESPPKRLALTEVPQNKAVTAILVQNKARREKDEFKTELIKWSDFESKPKTRRNK